MAQAAAYFEECGGTVNAAAGDILAAALNAHVILSAVADLDGQRGVVLFEHVVPNVERAITLCGEEDTWARGRPAAIGKVGRMIPKHSKLQGVIKMQRWSSITWWS